MYLASTITVMDAARLHKLARVLRELAIDVTSDLSEGRATPTEVTIGMDIFEHDATTVGEIAKRTGVAQSQVSTTVAAMRDYGLLSVESDPGDRRRGRITLDPAARRQLAGNRGRRPVSDAIRQHLLAHARAATAAEVRAVVQLLDALADRLLP
jgi:DNA-binding MarR family transcriptional regulator